VFIQRAEGGDLVGKVWAGDVLFPDFFHPNTSSYWKDMLQFLYNQINFSGVWLDMNEITNLCDGPCTPPNVTTVVIDYTNDIPYQPGGKSI
jgi:alpha-glucosidase (family GH31 glycosyl hydrolase)